jgi:plastocyanin
MTDRRTTACRRTWIAVLALCSSVTGLCAQVATVRVRVDVEAAAKATHGSSPTTVVWLAPVAGTLLGGAPVAASAPVRLTQKNKKFDPHVLVVPAGAAVEFPNRDPFFHNVFSLFEGKRFDLGLYEAGTSRVVHFDRPGVSYIFCNIHPEMSGVVITLNTPFYSVVNGEGQIELPNVPYGRYRLNSWSEGTGPENAQPEGREITIGESEPKLLVVRVPAINGQSLAHKNKYGRDYEAPSPNNPVYHP